jgi:hypothetical protein
MNTKKPKRELTIDEKIERDVRKFKRHINKTFENKTDRIIAGGLIPDMKKQLRAAYEREEQTKHTQQTSNPKP